MYQRSAVILEKYFSEKFYYKDRNNLKNNYENYCRLIEVLESYQHISEDEDKIINECEDIAAKIKQIQKNQNSLYKRNTKLEEDRNSLFENIDEPAHELTKQLSKIEKEIDENNEQMKPIGHDFIEALASFNETSQNRAEYGRKRRRIEKEYRSILEKTINNITEIEPEKISTIKKFIVEDDANSSEDLKKLMLKNGEKEKIPFDLDVIENSIVFGQKINKQEAKLLIDVYEKTNSLVNETENGSVKIKRYKKTAKDVKNKLEFIAVQKEYLTQFLDNERLSVNLGKIEHKKLMKNACEDFNNDIQQINNLNEILLKETANKATQKMYSSLYGAEYLIDLQKKEAEFENKLDELNLVGQILNPIYWRIGSIEKLYSIFDNIVTNEYGRDLSKFKVQDEPEETIDDESEGYMDYYDNLDKEENEDIDSNIKELDNDNKDDDYYEENSDDYDDDEFDDDYDNDYEVNIDDDEFDDDYEEDDYNDDDEEYGYNNGIEFDDEENDEYEEDDENSKNEKQIKESNASKENEEVYEEDDNKEEDEDDNVDEEYNDIDIILQNRKKILGKRAPKPKKSNKTNKQSKTSKMKGIFGLSLR